MISSALFIIFKCVLCTCTTFDRVACDSYVVAKCVPCKCAIFMDLTCGATFVTTFYCMKFKPLNLGCVIFLFNSNVNNNYYIVIKHASNLLSI